MSAYTTCPLLEHTVYRVVIPNSGYNLEDELKTAEVTHDPNLWDSYSNNPVYRYSGDVNIPEQVIHKGTEYSVTSIGDNAFWGCSGLTSITIPNSVTSIGWDVFTECTGLTSITIPNSVTSIGDVAFADCSGLTSITIPNSVTYIGERAFARCESLTSVTIGNSVTSIEEAAFEGCSGLTSIKVESGNTKYDSRDNCNAIIETTSNRLICGCNNSTIPNNVTSIGNYAFSCSGLTSITIPNSVTSIGDNAFSGCSGLTSIAIPNSVTSIGFLAFSGCSGLTSIAIPNSVMTIGEGAFSYSGLTSVTIPNSVMTIGEWAFSYSGLTSVTIPNSVMTIGEGAFYNCSGLTSIAIPNSVMTIREEAFYNCSGLTSVTIPNSVTSIGDNAFKGCSGLNSVTFHCAEIGDWFNNNTSIQEIVIGNEVTSIGSEAFYGCSGLTSIKVESGNTKYDSRNNCNAIIETASNTLINGCKNTTIPNSVTSIGNIAFSGCSGLTSITIPNSVTSIGDDAFYGCSGLTSVTIGSGIKTIGSYAFALCPKLTDVFCYAETVPSTEADAFINSHTDYATLHVPGASINNYKSKVPWSTFKTIVRIKLSTDDQIVVGDVSADKGKTATLAIGLNNKTTTLSAYQFDLTLPTGFTLSKDDKGKFQVSKTNRYEDEEQTLNVSAVEGSNNTYRFVCFSLSNSVIEGTSGAILNAIIDAANSVEPGSYEAQISDIVFTKADGTQLWLNAVKFNIVVNNVTKGDVNDDGEINVADIVEIVNFILGKPSAKFVEAAADLSGDGEVNVTDIVMVVNIIMSAQSSAARSRDGKVEVPTVNDLLTLTEVDNGDLSLSLENRGDYVASQFDVRLSDGQALESITLNGYRSGRHQLTYAKMGNNIYKVIVYSLSNETFIGNSGELMDFKIVGSGNVSIENIVFVTARHQEKWFAPLSSGTTGIETIDHSTLTTDNYYDLQGRRVIVGGKKGILIKNGKKHVVK